MIQQHSLQRHPARLSAACMVLLLILTTVLASARGALAADASFTVDWNNSSNNVSGFGNKSVFPSVAVDSNNRTHIVYLDQDDSRLLYTNNVDGSFKAPQVVSNNVGTGADPSLVIDRERNNTLHVGYADGSVVRYRQGTLSGSNVTWSNSQVISNSASRAFSGSVALDNAGNVHITWIDNRCGQYNVFYRVRFANGTLGPTSAPKSDCEYETKPRLAITNDGKAHILFQYKSSGEMYYSRFENGSWTAAQNLSASSSRNSSSPAITTDGTNLFVSWGEGIAVGNHDVLFRASFNGGQSWSNTIAMSNSPQFAEAPHMVYSPASQRVYITWFDNTNSSKYQIWYREFDPTPPYLTSAPKRLTNSPGDTGLPTIAAGPSHVSVSWQDRNTTNVLQVYYLGGSITTVASGCTGTVAIENNAAQSRTNPIHGVITPICANGGAPDMMQVSLDAPITSAESPPQEPYNANLTISVPTGNCTPHTVYVQLYKSGVSGAAFNSAPPITVDGTVDANVGVLNPYLVGLPDSYTPVGIADTYANNQGGASNGDPRYTRNRAFFLEIQDAGDCSGLKNFFVPGSIGGNIPSTGYNNAIALPGDGSPGTKTFNIVISDTIDNIQIYPSIAQTYAIIYDPDNPVLNGGSVSGDSNTGTIMRTLSFSGINVTDAAYGQYENLPAGQQFWGMWLANVDLTATPNITPDNPGLKWFPVEGRMPSTKWSLFSGLGYGPTPGHEGTYRVFVRFLDGAGNPTQGVISTTLTLDAGYTVPQTFLPAVSK